MANRSKNQRRAGSRAARTGGKRSDSKRSASNGKHAASQRAGALRKKPGKSQDKRSLKKKSAPIEAAQGRLDHGPAVAVIDIGSNSVRLVVYEGLARSPTPIFNEKVLAGLGREVQSTGLLAPDAVAEALQALTRFRALCDTLQVGRVFGIATAACRDADNGPAFIREAERICRIKIDILSGRREAELAALGVVSGIYKPEGIAVDCESAPNRRVKFDAATHQPASSSLE